MKRRRDLESSLLYESVYAPVQTYEKNNDLFKKKFVKNEERRLWTELHAHRGRWLKTLSFLWQSTFGRFGEEWFFLSFLGIIVALISYGIDKASTLCNQSRVWLFKDLAEHPWARYFGWISLPICLIMFSTGLVKFLAPKVTGSGIPEVKTILRGFYINDFLTFRALIAKVLGITATLGSGMPLGKEGPLIHISCCITNLLGKLANFQMYQNESRKVEMLAAAACVGVGCTFGAPIGGVLLSVEITTAYYGVRNYWRGFCTAIWGTTVYRLLLVWIEGVESVTVVFKTNFFVDTPFAAQELFAFSILGIICGLGSAFYMRMKIMFGQFVKNSKNIKAINKASIFIYPGFVTLVVSSISFPLGIGQFMAGHMGYAIQVTNLFANFTWTADHLTVAQQEIVNNWQTKHTGIYLHLVCMMAFNFVCSILAASMPIPSGSFGPTFRVGAAIGRIFGELMHVWYPTGLSYRGRITKIIPGGYSTVGAAAFAGGITQTMSVSVIVLEMTGQMTHVIPILIAVLISNSIAQLCGPSVYNLGIKSKNLPYLPDMLPRNSAIYSVFVEDFMSKEVKCIYHGMSFEKLKQLLIENRKVQSFPLVNNPQKMILLGSIQRMQLVGLMERQVGRDRRYLAMTDHEEKFLRNYSRDSFQPLFPVDKFTENPLYREPVKEEEAKLVKYRKARIYDLTPAAQKRWEEFQLKRPVDFSTCRIDPAPFQLVEKTSLLKVHSIFSLLGINTAYVTSTGRLIGVVSLREVRQAIEDVKSGSLQPHDIDIVITDVDGTKQ